MADQEQTTETQSEGNPEVETRARNMGWRGRESYRGKPELFVDAEEFIRKGETELPVMRERLRKAEQTAAELRELKASVSDLVRSQGAATRRMVEEAIATERSKRREAIQIGDADAVEKHDAKIEKLKEDKAEAEKVEKAPKANDPLAGLSPEDRAAYETFVEQEGAWFNKDLELTQEAHAAHELLLKQNPNMRPKEILKRVKAKLLKLYPEKFDDDAEDEPAPVRRRASPVDGGGVPKGGVRGRTWADLPAEIRPVAEKVIQQTKMTKDAYLKTYFGQ